MNWAISWCLYKLESWIFFFFQSCFTFLARFYIFHVTAPYSIYFIVEKEIDLEAFKMVEDKLKHATVSDFQNCWYDIKKLLCKIQSGGVPSYRHDVFKNLKTHHFCDKQKSKVKKTDLQYSRKCKIILKNDSSLLMFSFDCGNKKMKILCNWHESIRGQNSLAKKYIFLPLYITDSLSDDVDNLIWHTIIETFPSSKADVLKYVCDVLMPAAYKFFVSSYCELGLDEVQYFIENYGKLVYCVTAFYYTELFKVTAL